MVLDKQLVREATTCCGGGLVHRVVQMTAAYEMAVARANHPRCQDRDNEARTALALEAQIRAMMRRTR